MTDFINIVKAAKRRTDDNRVERITSYGNPSAENAAAQAFPDARFTRYFTSGQGLLCGVRAALGSLQGQFQGQGVPIPGANDLISGIYAGQQESGHVDINNFSPDQLQRGLEIWARQNSHAVNYQIGWTIRTVNPYFANVRGVSGGGIWYGPTRCRLRVAQHKKEAGQTKPTTDKNPEQAAAAVTRPESVDCADHGNYSDVEMLDSDESEFQVSETEDNTNHTLYDVKITDLDESESQPLDTNKDDIDYTHDDDETLDSGQPEHEALDSLEHNAVDVKTFLNVAKACANTRLLRC
ncbi:hypothetical protein F4678DRAFT_456951 [Xylaria arbuscula]|nr:hypothetical protein F4678DRAFT_456951 [Xylaria arbuscula]